jgi:dGTPase
LINFYVTKLINDTNENLGKLLEKYKISTTTDFHIKKIHIKSENQISDIANFDKDFRVKDDEFSNFLRARILNSHLAQRMDGKANYILRQSIKAYLTNPQQLPDATIISLYEKLMNHADYEKLTMKSPAEIIGVLRNELIQDHSQHNKAEYRTMLLRTICDHIAGMTDQYAMKQYDLLYGSKQID